ncbi:hypothetical protein DFH28DRAFT_926614 [Melampsora americana]|nr:hypothetical protein DFH28DRAFT_926614 [Melampsora americana]
MSQDPNSIQEKKNHERDLRIENSIKESYSYQALNPNLWFRLPSDQEEDQDEVLQDKRIGEIGYKLALKEYEACLELCLEHIKLENQNNKKANLFENILTCCLNLSTIEDSRVLKLIELSKEHWRNVPSVGLRAAKILLKLKDEEGALLATVSAIIHCGDLRIRNLIFQALSQTSNPNQIIQSFIDQLIKENSTPRLMVNRLRLLGLNHLQSEVTWDDISKALMDLSQSST